MALYKFRIIIIINIKPAESRIPPYLDNLLTWCENNCM